MQGKNDDNSLLPDPIRWKTQKSPLRMQRAFLYLAEGVGFEPTVGY